MKQLVVVAILVLSLTGCARVESSYVVTGQPQVANAGSVEIVMEGQTPRPGVRRDRHRRRAR